MKKLLFGLLPLVFAASIFAQTTPAGTVRPLTIGDTVPDMVYEVMINYPGGTARFSDFKGKLLILDFWDKHCATCISSFPGLERLQDEYGDQVQILLIARNTMEELAPLFEKNPTVKATRLPMIINNPTLESLFPHTAVPYHVWVDGNRIVRASTGFYGTNRSNIDTFLKTDIVNLPVRTDVMDLEFLRSSLIEQTAAADRWQDLEYYSLITKKNQATAQTTAGILSGSFNGSAGISFINHTIISLFVSACKPNLGKFKAVTVIPSSKGNYRKYYKPDDKGKWEQWFNENLYCYELKLPNRYKGLSRREQKRIEYQYMQADLERYFSIHATVEEREINCIVLSRINDISLSASEKNDLVYEVLKDSTAIIQNGSIEMLAAIIKPRLIEFRERMSTPILDETGYIGRVDMSFRISNTVEGLNGELHKYGLLIKEEKRFMPCLILTEIN